MGDDSKRLILARRARFIAAALASATAGATACGGNTEPQPCLSLATDAGNGADTGPQVCLSPPSTVDSGAQDADADAAPQPCLSPPIDAGDQ